MPAEYVETFEPMLMQAPTSSYANVKSIIEEESGKKLDEIFSEFAETPVASASLG